MKFCWGILALLLFCKAANAALCPVGYDRLQEGNCYRLYDKTEEWNEARQFCTKLGHHLVAMETMSEVNWLKQTFRETGWWTGGYYNEGRYPHGWRWYNPNKTAMTLRNWADGKPEDAENGGCVAIDENYKWSNFDNTDLKKFVCEAKPGCNIETLNQQFGHLVPQYQHPSVPVNEDIRVQCDRQQGWKGSFKVRCKGENVWKPKRTCSRIQCGRPERIEHQIVTTIGVYEMGDTYNYGCNTGYELDYGVIMPVCTEHETWSDTNAECKPVTCNRPSIRNGGYEAPNGLKYRKTVTFYCDAGYHLVGVQSTICQANKQLAGDIPRCDVVTCNRPSIRNGGYEAPNGLKYGKTVTFYCDAGYHLFGVQSTICQANKQLADIPRCVAIVCDSLEPLQNGRISATNRGGSALFFCHEGYELKGESTLQCLWDDEHQGFVWDKEPPVCEKTTCPALPEITNGGYSGDMSSGGTVHFSCIRGYHLVGVESVMCNRGQWSGSSYPTCEVNTCPMIEVPDASLRLLRGGQGDDRSYAYGDRIYFTCNEGYEMDGAASTVCNVDGRWTSQPPTCLPKSCPALTTPRHCSKDVTALHYGGVASFHCHPGYFLEGSTISHCLKDGTWSNEPPECTACGLGTYRSENDLEISCIPCPERSSTVTSASHSPLQCTCETGTVGPPGGPCTATECATLAAPEHGSKQCSVDARDNEECTFQCSPGYKIEGARVRTCTPSGWDGRSAVCVECPADTFKDEFTNMCVPCPQNTYTNGKTGAVQSDCVCKQGYRRSLTGDECFDIDECAFDNGNCGQRCINYGGGFQCSCPIPGYVLDADSLTCIQNQTCSDLGQKPNHGNVSCQEFENENSKLCFIRCDPGYFFVSGKNNYLTCGSETGFQWSHQRSNNTARPPSCTREFFVDTAVPVSITYSVDEPYTCNTQGDQSIRQQMSEFVQSVLNTANQGTGRCNEGDRGLCGFVNMTVSCDKNGQTEVETKFALVVRNFNPNAINPNDTSCGSNCGRSNLRLMLRRTMAARGEVSELLTQGPTVMQNDSDSGIVLSPGDPVFGRLILMCAEPGRVFTSDRLCVPCDKGYYLPKQWMTHCVPCPRGFFQRQEGQTSCKSCLEGSTTVGEGADSPTQCNVEVATILVNTTVTTPTPTPTPTTTVTLTDDGEIKEVSDDEDVEVLEEVDDEGIEVLEQVDNNEDDDDDDDDNADNDS